MGYHLFVKAYSLKAAACARASQTEGRAVSRILEGTKFKGSMLPSGTPDGDRRSATSDYERLDSSLCRCGNHGGALRDARRVENGLRFTQQNTGYRPGELAGEGISGPKTLVALAAQLLVGRTRHPRHHADVRASSRICNARRCITRNGSRRGHPNCNARPV